MSWREKRAKANLISDILSIDFHGAVSNQGTCAFNLLFRKLSAVSTPNEAWAAVSISQTYQACFTQLFLHLSQIIRAPPWKLPPHAQHRLWDGWENQGKDVANIRPPKRFGQRYWFSEPQAGMEWFEPRSSQCNSRLRWSIAKPGKRNTLSWQRQMEALDFPPCNVASTGKYWLPVTLSTCDTIIHQSVQLH